MNKITIFILVLAGTIMFQSCSQDKNENTEEISTKQTNNLIVVSQKQFERSAMQTGKIRLKIFKEKIRTTGKISTKPKGKALINSLFPGIVKKVFVAPEQKVVKGQKLCSITGMGIVSLQQEFSEVAAKLDNLKQNYLRKKELHENKVLSDKEFETAKSEYLGTLGTYNGLKQKILMMKLSPGKILNGNIYSEIYLTSPINGYISNHNCLIGQSVNAGDNLFEVINIKSLQLEFFVFEKDISKIKTGQGIIFFMPDNENLKYEGKIKAIGKSVNNETKTVTCYAETDTETSENLAENMFMNVDVISSEFKKYALPENAIVYSETETYILKLEEKDADNYYFAKKNIKPGQTYNGFTEVMLNDTAAIFLEKGAYNLLTE
ncbi:MAG: efflux RND transporter periplasmic adaptor subunit [Bacteroidales bacterium]|nr:efflux RND transporter periplasmic adaptor subunit [Bacteroidales bacterium]